MRRLFLNLKIQERLFLILFLTSIIISVTSLSAFQFSLSSYDNILQQEIKDVLTLSSNIAEAKVKEIDEISFKIVTDKTVQGSLKIVKSTSSPSYKRYAAIDQLEDIILPWSQYRNYIASISIIDSTNKQYSWGRTSKAIRDADEIISLRNNAYDNKGKAAWVEPAEDNNFITVVRDIRCIQNLTFESLGTLVLRIYPAKLFEENQLLHSKYFANMYVLSSDNITIYQSNKQPYTPNRFAKLNANNSYYIEDTGNGKLIMSHITSPYTGWKFIIAIPYNIIYGKIIATRDIMLAVCLCAFGIAIFLGMMLYKGITVPVSQLTEQMKALEQGNFEITDEINITAGQNRLDEIGKLQQDFYLMVKRINDLIKENYLKHITMQEAELKALQAQINPHFLYNTLESINWMAKINKQEPIAIMAKSLGNLLRNSIDTHNLLVPLKEELAILKDYLTIQSYRYEERLSVSIDIPDQYLNAMIPKLSLQPLIENSIQHGLEKLEGACQITVSATELKDCLCITVSDNGPGISEQRLEKLNNNEINPSGNSIGIKNIDERLKIVFGSEYGLKIESTIGYGTQVHMLIPYKGDEEVVQSIAGR
jgi:two-component system sensor histidine kinase YesM